VPVGLSTVTTLFPKACEFKSRAVIGSSAAGTAGVGTELLPYNTAPAVGSGLDFASRNSSISGHVVRTTMQRTASSFMPGMLMSIRSNGQSLIPVAGAFARQSVFLR